MACSLGAGICPSGTGRTHSHVSSIRQCTSFRRFFSGLRPPNTTCPMQNNAAFLAPTKHATEWRRYRQWPRSGPDTEKPVPRVTGEAYGRGRWLSRAMALPTRGAPICISRHRKPNTYQHVLRFIVDGSVAVPCARLCSCGELVVPLHAVGAQPEELVSLGAVLGDHAAEYVYVVANLGHAISRKHPVNSASPRQRQVRAEVEPAGSPG